MIQKIKNLIKILFSYKCDYKARAKMRGYDLDEE